VIVDNLIKVRPGMAVQARPAATGKDAAPSPARAN